jgi:ketosteroid isomerase-like protein
MSTDTNKQTAREFFESVDKGDASASQALLTPDFTAHVAGNEHAMNAQEFLAMGQ